MVVWWCGSLLMSCLMIQFSWLLVLIARLVVAIMVRERSPLYQ